MKDLHEVAGVSKQAFHKARICCSRKDVKVQEFLKQADKIRKEHPGAGCRKMAADLVYKGWGRDKIERLLLDNGYLFITMLCSGSVLHISGQLK